MSQFLIGIKIDRIIVTGTKSPEQCLKKGNFMDREIMAWFGLIKVRFADLFLTDSYTDEKGRTIDLRKL